MYVICINYKSSKNNCPIGRDINTYAKRMYSYTLYYILTERSYINQPEVLNTNNKLYNLHIRRANN